MFGPSTRAALAALSLLAILLSLSGRAHAYVRYRTEAGVPWQWRGTSCLPIVAYPVDFGDMTADEVGTAAQAAAAAWSAAQNPCTYLTLEVSLSVDPGPLVVPKGNAAVVFRDTRWCRLLADGSCSTKPEDTAVYQDTVLMLTSTKPTDNKSGTIAISAVEVNAVDFSWADLVIHPELGTGTHDLQNGLTHELGHFIGLDHNCAPGGAVVLDGQGNPAPSCDFAPVEITEATMFVSAMPGDVGKRTLANDDTRGLCDTYPVADDPKVCAPPWENTDAGCGCVTAQQAAPSALAILLGALAALVLARRSRASR